MYTRRKARLAQSCTDGAQFVAALRFYCYWLCAGKAVGVAYVRDKYKDQTRTVKRALKLARRLLSVYYSAARNTATLSPFYKIRLRRVGLDLNNPLQRKEFESLNPHLAIEGAMQSFARRYPILAEVQQLFASDLSEVAPSPPTAPSAFSRSPPTDAPKVAPESLSSFSQQVQQGITNHLLAQKFLRMSGN